jgi:twitching motility protein PilT
VSALDLFVHIVASAITRNASDVHVEKDGTVWFRVHGDIAVEPNVIIAPDSVVEYFCGEGSKTDQTCASAMKAFKERGVADFGLSLELPGGIGARRLRVHFKRVQGRTAFSFRVIPNKVASMDTLGTPEAFRGLLHKPYGLLLVCGQTGSGKSTTLAASVQSVLNEQKCKVVTFESPVEATLTNSVGLVEQHEVGPDADLHDFQAAIRSSMREDPEIILIGEMRDAPTIIDGLRAADTGHLIISTLHTGTAVDSTSRLMDAAPANEKEFYQSMLAGLLVGVLCQKLLPRIDRPGRVAAYELMVVNDAIRAQIKGGHKNAIYDTLSSSRTEGMISFARSMAELVGQKIVDEAVAVSYLPDRREFDNELKNWRARQGTATVTAPASRPTNPLAPRPR